MPAPTDAPMKPLIFGSRSILAWQQGAKTQTRRLVKPQPWNHRWRLIEQRGHWSYKTHPDETATYWLDWNLKVRQPYAVGDLLWIREALKRGKFGFTLYATHPVDYLRDGELDIGEQWTWKRDKLPAMFMPRWACRYYAKVISVRPERLQDITDEDAVAEGTVVGIKFPTTWCHGKSRSLYLEWWDSLHKKPGARAEDNPWVWVYGLEKADGSTA